MVVDYKYLEQQTSSSLHEIYLRWKVRLFLQIVVLLLCVFAIPTTATTYFNQFTLSLSQQYNSTYKTETIAIMDAAIITQAAEVLTAAPTERVLSSF